MAVVLHGIVGGVGGRGGTGPAIDFEICAETIKHNILSAADCDIFMHSWSTEHENALISLYQPKNHLFQPQEMMGFDISPEDLKIEDKTHFFRSMSRYTSLERAMLLKTLYEIENKFIYNWVIALRYDLVFFNKLNLNQLDNSNMYICTEPHWPNIQNLRVVHDIVFLSSSPIMDEYCNIAQEIRRGIYGGNLEAHGIAFRKLNTMFNGTERVKYGFKRYEDVEIYRFIVKPELNPIGHQYGALETKSRMETLLEEIK